MCASSLCPLRVHPCVAGLRSLRTSRLPVARSTSHSPSWSRQLSPQCAGHTRGRWIWLSPAAAHVGGRTLLAAPGPELSHWRVRHCTQSESRRWTRSGPYGLEPANRPHTGTTGFLPTLRPLRGRSGRFAATSASRFQDPALFRVLRTCDARFSSAIARSPLSALPAFVRPLCHLVQQLEPPTVDAESSLQHTCRLRPAVG